MLFANRQICEKIADKGLIIYGCNPINNMRVYIEEDLWER